MICHLHRIGIDNEKAYEEIAELARKAPQFRFDWWMRSRTAVDIQRRCNTLVGLIEREIIGEQEKDHKRRGPKVVTIVHTPIPVKKRDRSAQSGGIEKKRKDTKVTGTPVSQPPRTVPKSLSKRKRE